MLGFHPISAAPISALTSQGVSHSAAIAASLVITASHQYTINNRGVTTSSLSVSSTQTAQCNYVGEQSLSLTLNKAVTPKTFYGGNFSGSLEISGFGISPQVVYDGRLVDSLVISNGLQTRLDSVGAINASLVLSSSNSINCSYSGNSSSGLTINSILNVVMSYRGGLSGILNLTSSGQAALLASGLSSGNLTLSSVISAFSAYLGQLSESLVILGTFSQQNQGQVLLAGFDGNLIITSVIEANMSNTGSLLSLLALTSQTVPSISYRGNLNNSLMISPTISPRLVYQGLVGGNLSLNSVLSGNALFKGATNTNLSLDTSSIGNLTLRCNVSEVLSGVSSIRGVIGYKGLTAADLVIASAFSVNLVANPEEIYRATKYIRRQLGFSQYIQLQSSINKLIEQEQLINTEVLTSKGIVGNINRVASFEVEL